MVIDTISLLVLFACFKLKKKEGVLVRHKNKENTKRKERLADHVHRQ
jgi:hypothetical protein